MSTLWTDRAKKILGFFTPQISILAASLSYWSILMLAPFLIITMSIIVHIPVFDFSFIERTVDLLPQEIKRALYEAMNNARKYSATASLLSLAGAYVIAWQFNLVLSRSMKMICLSGTMREYKDWLWALIMPLVQMVAVIVASVSIVLVPAYITLVDSSFKGIVSVALPVFVLTLMFIGFVSTLFKTRCFRYVFEVLPFWILWLTVLQSGFSIYVSHIFRTWTLYGSGSAFILLLVWIYFFFVGFLLSVRYVSYRCSKPVSNGT